MADSHEFERRLERLFDVAPAYPDDQLFAARVHDKLEAKDGVRRAVMGLVGGAGAFIAAYQLVRANLTLQVAQASAVSTEAVEQGWAGLTRDAGALLSGAAVHGELVWTVAGLGLLALGFLATRMADEF